MIGNNFDNITNILNQDLNYSSDSKVKKNDEEEGLKEVTKDFESFFNKQILEAGLVTSNANTGGKGAGSEIIKDMYVDSIAENTKGHIGISNMLFEHLSKNNK